MGRAVVPQIELGDIELMEKILSTGSIQHKFAVRIQAVLGRARRQSTKDLAFILGLNAVTVSRYVHRYNEGGVDALLRDRTRKPGKQPISAELKTSCPESYAMKNRQTVHTGAHGNWQSGLRLGTHR